MSKFKEVTPEQCSFCNYKLIPKKLNVKSNADTSKILSLIAQGDKRKELVFVVNDIAYGIEIDYCPMCGRKLIV